MAVAYGTRRDQFRSLPPAEDPGSLRRPKTAGHPLGVTAVPAGGWFAIPRRQQPGATAHGRATSLRRLQAAAAYLCRPACGCSPRPAPTSAPEGPRPAASARAAPELPRCRRGTLIALLHRSLHTPAASVLRTPRPATPAILRLWSLTDLTLPLTVAPAMPGPATRGANPPIRPHPSIPVQKISL